MLSFAGQRCHWLRCRIADRTRSGKPATVFSQPPEVYAVGAGAVGALLPAAHSARERGEILGESDGTPGQSFLLKQGMTGRMDFLLGTRQELQPVWRAFGIQPQQERLALGHRTTGRATRC